MAIKTHATTASVRSPGRPISHLPRTAEASSQGPASIAIPASSAPPVFAPSAASQCPRTACDQEVVMPQDGQRTPSNHTNVQGGSPNCRCVPKPFGSGRNMPATVRAASKPKAIAANPSRLFALNLVALWGTDGTTAEMEMRRRVLRMAASGKPGFFESIKSTACGAGCQRRDIPAPMTLVDTGRREVDRGAALATSRSATCPIPRPRRQPAAIAECSRHVRWFRRLRQCCR